MFQIQVRARIFLLRGVAIAVMKFLTLHGNVFRVGVGRAEAREAVEEALEVQVIAVELKVVLRER